jgi:alpha-maltose-1-phosphate synthase
VILLSHPTANESVRQVALALVEADLLAEFWTCVSWKRDSFLDKSLAFSNQLRRQLRRRSFPEKLIPFVRTLPWRELGRQAADQLGWNWITNKEDGWFSIDTVYRSLDCRVANRLSSRPMIDVVYGYDGGALESFRVAKGNGIKRLYEHPIIYWRKVRQIQDEEAQRSPEWASTLTALTDSEEKNRGKDEELALADIIIVPSMFAKESLAGVPGLKTAIRVVPYGTFTADVQPQRSNVEKLRVLFVGALSQAKGLGYLLEAVTKLEGAIEFTLIGRRINPVVPVPALLDKYQWIPSLPHNEVLTEMSRHDVLVLPSLHEGFGLVITEAMGQGLVVITTPSTGGPDVISEDIDGFLVPIRSAIAIEEKLALLVRDRTRLRGMQEAAWRKAASFTWDSYRSRVVQVAREVMMPTS